LIQSPIHKALLTFRNCNVQFLLMGGQACILYGGAEFSRDIDLSVGIDATNLAAIRKALDSLRAETIFVPSLGEAVLRQGHTCHFRCHADGVEGLRIDLMSKMRGCPDFGYLWERRSIISLPEIGEIGLLSLADLIQAKKTQREKDWPMISRLVETDIAQNIKKADEQKIIFWLKECRTPAMLIQLAEENGELCKKVMSSRPLLVAALDKNIKELESGLLEEEMKEREQDRQYWQPLKKELEQWRLNRNA